MMFIVGNKTKVRLLPAPPTNFHCPDCEEIQPFVSAETREYLELFLIPVVPMEPWTPVWYCTNCDYERPK